jgi:hypothetical protein
MLANVNLDHDLDILALRGSDSDRNCGGWTSIRARMGKDATVSA